MTTSVAAERMAPESGPARYLPTQHHAISFAPRLTLLLATLGWYGIAQTRGAACCRRGCASATI